MKIIDKNKDYYDYLQGVWGQDPNAVYVRTGSKVFSVEDRPLFLTKEIPGHVQAWQGEFILYCGNRAHHIYFENSREGIVTERILGRVAERPADAAPLRLECYVKEWDRNCPSFYGIHWRNMPSKDQFIARVRERLFGPTDPFMRKTFGLKWRSHRFEPIKESYDNPILMSFPLTVIPAEEVFTGIQEFLLSKCDGKFTDNRTDIEKLEAAGFDRKTSFRNIK